MAKNSTMHFTEFDEQLRNIIHTNHSIRHSVQQCVNEFLAVHHELFSGLKLNHREAFADVMQPLLETNRIEALNARVTSEIVQLALCGENSSGKTAFLQVFLRIGRILPSNDGPVSARIIKLTYAPAKKASVRVYASLKHSLESRNPTLDEDEIDLSAFFQCDPPKWNDIASVLAKYVERPVNIDVESNEFAEWAQRFVEIRLPSPTLKLGIAVYDTPGFLGHDAPVLRQILHDLVELVHPTLIFMYPNPSITEGAKSCFLAMKVALKDLDATSVFFLNSHADIDKMPNVKRGMNESQFLAVLDAQRAERYALLLKAPGMANEMPGGLPKSLDNCICFDMCSYRSQQIKPFGPWMNNTAIRRIIQFVANSDLAVAKRVTSLVLPAIDAFFAMSLVISHRTQEQLVQMQWDARHWHDIYFQFHKADIENFFSELYGRLFTRFHAARLSIEQRASMLNGSWRVLDEGVRLAIKLDVIKPAVNDAVRSFQELISTHLFAMHELLDGAASNEILIAALRCDINDLLSSLYVEFTVTPNSTVNYIANTIAAPLLLGIQRLHNLVENIDRSTRTEIITARCDASDRFAVQEANEERRKEHICRVLTDIYNRLSNQEKNVRLAVEEWINVEKAKLLSRIDTQYEASRAVLSLRSEAYGVIQRCAPRFVRIECQLQAAQDLAKFSGIKPTVYQENKQTTVFSLYPAEWDKQSNLIVKKLTRSIANQPNAAYYEAHYHRKVTALGLPRMINLLYLYEDRVDDDKRDLWMIFPKFQTNLKDYLEQEPSVELSLETLFKWIEPMFRVLAGLHRNEIVHRNVTLSNILINNDEDSFLADLGDWTMDQTNIDLNTRHDPSSTPNGTLDDIQALGCLGLHLCSFVKRNNKTSTLDAFVRIMMECSEASGDAPVTVDSVRIKLKELKTKL